MRGFFKSYSGTYSAGSRAALLPITRGNHGVTLRAFCCGLINKTSQRQPCTLHHHLLPHIFACLLWPDFFYLVELALQLGRDLVDLALHPARPPRRTPG
jgi:hypothetical protein